MIWNNEAIDEAELKGSLKNYITKHGREQSRIIVRLNHNKGFKLYRDWLLTNF